MKDLNRLRTLALRAAIAAALGFAGNSTFAQNAPATPAASEEIGKLSTIAGLRGWPSSPIRAKPMFTGNRSAPAIGTSSK